jgi:hypothetical protein
VEFEVREFTRRGFAPHPQQAALPGLGFREGRFSAPARSAVVYVVEAGD